MSEIFVSRSRRFAVGVVLVLGAGWLALSNASADGPPRVDLARLTVSEYRNAVADLVGSFDASVSSTSMPTNQDLHGLRGEYFRSAAKRNRTPLFSRTDAMVRFDFGPSSPDFDRVKTEPFSATLQGA